MVCHIDNNGIETVTQSSSSRGTAQKDVDDLNQHELENNRPQNYYYRPVKPGEFSDG